MKNRIFIFFILAFLPLSVFGYDDTPKCFQELESNFFEPELVSLSLSLFNISQSQWYQIGVDLGVAGQKIPLLLRRRAKKMKPDPFQHPFQEEKAMGLLREVTWEVFLSVMKYHGYSNTRQLQQIFGYFFDNRTSACRTSRSGKGHRGTNSVDAG